MRLTIVRKGSGTTVLGGKRPPSIAKQQAPVVRVLGVEAAFLRRSYVPPSRWSSGSLPMRVR